MARQTNQEALKKFNEQIGFRQWFEKVYNEYFERLYRYAFSITKSKYLAEDVVEEVFTNLWEKQDGHIEIKRLDSYLYVAIKHSAVRAASKSLDRFVYSYNEDALQITDTIDPESLLLSSELQKIISDAVKSLPPHCALVYELVKNQGRSYEEVSLELGISKKTVESHMYKALVRIKEKLAEYFETKSPRVRWLSTAITIAFSILWLV